MRVEDTFDYNNLRNENIFQGKRQVDIKWAMNSVSCVIYLATRKLFPSPRVKLDYCSIN